MKLNETKQQRKLRKEQAKLSALESNNQKNYVVCLKFGTKYSSEYVNVLYNMVQRNLTLEHEFVCFTENTNGLNPDIKTKSLPFSNEIHGWWYKPFFFNPQLGLNGTILFIDLDVIIFRNIDYLFTYMPEQFMIIRDFNRCRIKNYDKFNSSVFRLNTGQHSQVYYDFIKDPKQNCRRFHGDQDWIRHQIKSNYMYWPETWIQSYKWEMRGRPTMSRDETGKRNFQSPGEPNILSDTSIAVFHGDPNPHNCIDPWCKRYWH